MSGVLDLTAILVMYAFGEFVARKTHAIVDTVLTILSKLLPVLQLNI